MTCRALLLLPLCLSVIAACTADAGPGRIAADAPLREDFTMPGKVLVARCGSLDCHGDPYRSYRLYGFGGSRRDPSHRPDSPDTTDAELFANYDATVAIEPERTRAVAAGWEAATELTLVRKARGTEKHVGGARFAAGSAPDACLVGFLTGAADAEACTSALAEIDAARRP